MASQQPIKSIKSIILVLQIFGAFPLKYKNIKHKNIKNILGTIYTTVLLIVYIILLMLTFSGQQVGKEVNYYANRIIALLLAATTFIILITSIVNRKNLFEILKLLVTFDQNLINKLNIVINYKNSFIFTVLITTIITIILITSALCDMLFMVPEYETRLKWFVLFTAIFTNSYYQVFIGILAYLLYQRFSKLNETLTKICKPKWHQFVVVKPKVILNCNEENCNTSYHIEILRIVRTLNEDLRYLTNKICSNFSLSILISTGTAFFIVTVQVYYLINVINMEPSEDSNKKLNTTRIWKLGICLFNFVVIHCFITVLIVSCFYYVNEEVI